GAGRIAGRIRILALTVGAAPPYIEDRLRVRRPREAAEGLAVVLVVVRELASFVFRRLRHPEVPCSSHVQHPGDLAAGRSRHQIGGERRGKDLLQRRSGSLERAGGQQDQRKGGDRSHNMTSYEI